VTIERGASCGFVARAILLAAALLGFAAGNIPAADPDPDWKAVQELCGRCYTTAIFVNKPRSWNRWNDVFADMTQRGANGTDEQLMRVTRYFLENLTLVNVNRSPADELSGVLGVSDEWLRPSSRAASASRSPTSINCARCPVSMQRS
jgi:hypothetical protein